MAWGPPGRRLLSGDSQLCSGGLGLFPRTCSLPSPLAEPLDVLRLGSGSLGGAVLWLGEVLVDFLNSRLRLLCRLGAAALSVGVVVLYFLVDQILARQALALSAAVTFPLLAVIPPALGSTAAEKKPLRRIGG